MSDLCCHACAVLEGVAKEAARAEIFVALLSLIDTNAHTMQVIPIFASIATDHLTVVL